jgi:coenzyme F420-reducing hydrogenase gamma subunit
MGSAHIKEDYYIGGCPPHHNHVGAAIAALLSLFIRLDRNESSHTYTEADVR